MDDDDNPPFYPSLPTNYVTILDLQKRWLHQKQQQKEKPMKEDINNEEKQRNSQFQNPISNNVKLMKSKMTKFNDDKPSQTKKMMKSKKNLKVGKRDYDDDHHHQDEEKGEVNNDDKKVGIEPNSKEVSVRRTNGVYPRSTAEIKGSKRVNLGYRRVENREIEDKSRGPVREGKQLHGGNRRFKRRENKKKDSIVDDQIKDQTVEIESKFNEISVSEKNWESMRVHRSYRRDEHRGFNLKKNQDDTTYDQNLKSGVVMEEERRVYRGYGRGENRGFSKKWVQRGRGFRSTDEVGPRGGKKEMVWVKKSEMNA